MPLSKDLNSNVVMLAEKQGIMSNDKDLADIMNNNFIDATKNLGITVSNLIHILEALEYVTQPAFTCSKLTTETLEEGVKYVQS